MFVNGSADDVYKFGGEFNRKMLESTPLKNNKKYVSVTSIIQYLTPNTASIPHTDWHCDPGVSAPFLQDAYLHILCSSDSKITSNTEFFDKPVDFLVDDYYLTARHREFREHLTPKVDDMGIKPKAIEMNKMVTFTNLHAHRAVNPIGNELRYFWRVQESDVDPPKPLAHSMINSATVMRKSDSKIIPSIEQKHNMIVIRNNIDMF
jgi:hypothetical protein